jgi:hypothetical protein
VAEPRLFAERLGETGMDEVGEARMMTPIRIVIDARTHEVWAGICAEIVLCSSPAHGPGRISA